MARRGDGYALGGLAALLGLKLFVEYGRVRLAQQAGDRRRGSLVRARRRARSSTGSASAKPSWMRDVTLGLVWARGADRRRRTTNRLAASAAAARPAAPERSGFGRHRATGVRFELARRQVGS